MRYVMSGVVAIGWLVLWLITGEDRHFIAAVVWTACWYVLGELRDMRKD